MGGLEAKGLVEPDRVGAALVGGQLHQAAAITAGLFDRPADHRPAHALSAPLAGDADTLDLGAEHAAPAQPWHHGQLQGPGDLPVDIGHDDPVTRVRRDVIERRQVRVVGHRFTAGSQDVIGEQRHYPRQLIAARVPEGHHLPDRTAPAFPLNPRV